ncbi:MAG: hypothetical protein QXH55_02250 [Candidatus Korarchaeota archaeon]|nr:hypothetical protein [Thermoproteota archaeon]MCR8462952.1 hypothetical protein [Thermoproteota archaeon]MCR8471133.1 hypothetical protein [Thermoproteota archaeon]MCR8471418.1 hypothetical protein [Thermoproteota archaeon]MCR8473168.1 hypothetical protein [Thermoproteota archaeon]
MVAIIGLATRLQIDSVENQYEYIKQNLADSYDEDFGILTNEASLRKLITRLKNHNIIISVVLTGGTKKLIVNLGKLRKPMILVSNDKQNALSSSLHALYILRDHNKKILHIQGDLKTVPWNSVRKVISGINGLLSNPARNIVLIGVSSNFLEEEKYNLHSLKDKFGLSVKTVSLRKFLKQLTKAEPDEGAISKMLKILEKTKTDDICEKIAKIHAVSKLLMKGSIAGGIRCFPIISKVGVTPCFVVSDFLDEGKIFGCEADLAAIISMLLAKYITGEIPFVANPITLEKTGRLTLAHCTAATKLFSSDAKLSEHFESKKGYAVEGSFRENSTITLLKVDPGFSKLLLIRGQILVGKRFSNEFCRNQVVVGFEKEPLRILSGEFAHHLIMIYGDHTTELKYAAELLGLELVNYY